MLWFVFVCMVLPPGALLLLCLTSGNSAAMALACRLLKVRMQIGKLEVSPGCFMCGLCSILAFISFASLRKYETQATEGLGMLPSQAITLQDRFLMRQRYQERNLYMSLLCLMLWGTAWRLGALRNRKQLVPAASTVRHMGGKMMYLVVAIVALLSADIPLCRINYNLQLMMFVTPGKDRLLANMGPCEDAVLDQASGHCQEFCWEVRKLSEERAAAIANARRCHILGRFAAQVFDDARGVEQDGRVDDLFTKKPCARILRSVDKSNQIVNLFCFLFAGLAVTSAFASMSAFLDTGDTESTGAPVPGVPWKPEMKSD